MNNDDRALNRNGEMEEHKQVSMAVNVPVDEGIIPLVRALTNFTQILTLESCQGGRYDEREGDSAWVAFGHAPGSHMSLYEFVKWLSSRLSDIPGPDFWFKLSLAWYRGGDEMAFLRCSPQPGHIRSLGEAIGEVQRRQITQDT